MNQTAARSELIRAILLMTAAMATFACGDALVNFLSDRTSSAQIIMTFGLGSIIIFGGLALAQGQSLHPRGLLDKGILARLVAEMVGTIGMITALTLAPLATVSAIMQATPLFVTMGAAIALRETVGWRRWTAVIVGFLGVLVILNPFSTSFDPNALWAILGVLGLSVRDLATRFVPKDMGSSAVSFFSTLGLLPLGLVMMPIVGTTTLEIPTLLLLVVLAIFGGTGYLFLTAALRLSEISAVSPFRYTRLIFTIFLAIVLLGERPSFSVYLGSAIVVASGLFILWRERRVA
ncbi:MAG: DMT family transporter [Pseudomonadota bacterium]